MTFCLVLVYLNINGILQLELWIFFMSLMHAQIYFRKFIFLPHIILYCIVDVIEQLWKFKLDDQLVISLIKMKAKWLSYYRNVPPVTLVAFVLDPR